MVLLNNDSILRVTRLRILNIIPLTIHPHGRANRRTPQINSIRITHLLLSQDFESHISTRIN